ncbi:hypothetical protein AS034_20160 [[Bacillus] enclensis]|uniref:Uncharacterized protein n=1 Tax=[Bacillus] enclensis TaxID=1402860 RepID=A0A0V8H7C8_9BACI|nr:hypothetical protein [[Bacillus] enclensis]KSU58389.1 hypothetical protein AS034_20160 [[Bacillus] enclensis]QWC21055.1 hypothetical protein KJK41_11920 [Bacillus haikouensis]SCC34843.1 hypothetical protein GA0061094_4178 [[Bacillus] enclensis]
MEEYIRNNQEMLIIIYCIIILWLNIGYLREYKKIKRGLDEIASADELEINPYSMSLDIMVLVFNFFRRWLIYILAVTMTGNPVVLIISVILFIFSLYDCLFNYTIERLRKSNLLMYLAVADTIYIAGFVVYLIMN